MIATSQVPLSQNTAPVFKFDCLYTHDLVRKQKRWQDGILAFHTFNKRVMVYDLTSNFIGDTHWRDSDVLNPGDDLKLDRGILVEVGEAKGRKDQDISEIFAKKSGPIRTQTSPARPVLTQLNSQKPKSLSRGRIGRADLSRTQSSISAWSSPAEFDSPRPTKRPRIENERRPVLAEKTAVNPPVPAFTDQAISTNKFNKQRVNYEEDDNIVEIDRPVGFDKKARKTQGFARANQENASTKKSKKSAAETKQLEDELEHESPGSKSTAKKSKTKSKSMPAQVEDHDHNEDDQTTTTSKKKTPKKRKKKSRATDLEQEPSQRASSTKTNNTRHEPSRNGYAVAKEDLVGTAENPATSARPKLLLKGSKTRRKRLISLEMHESTNMEGQSALTTRRSPSPSTALPKSTEDPQKEESSNTSITANQDIILISSAEKEQDDLEYSDDDEDVYITPLNERGSARRKSVSVCGKDGLSSLREPSARTETPSGNKSSAVDRVTAEDGQFDDSSHFSGLPGDETLLEALADSPTMLRTTNVTKDNEMPSRSDAASKQEDPKTTDVLPDQPDNNSEAPITSIPESPPSQPTARPLGQPAPPLIPPPEIQVPASPPLLSRSFPPQPPSTQQQQQPPPPNPFRPLAPLTNLLPDLPPLPPQKPLPQFRAPSRRTPLQKSLSNITPSSHTNPTLNRSASDGIPAVSVGVEAYHQEGPWTREAFDLFGWSPGMDKGKTLGPVAGRACGCRAGATAKKAAELVEKAEKREVVESARGTVGWRSD